MIENINVFIFLCLAILCAWNDWKEYIIPDRYIVIGAIWRMLSGMIEILYVKVPIYNQILLMIGILVVLLMVGFKASILDIRGLGGGDIKFLMLAALFLKPVVWVIVFAFSIFLLLPFCIWNMIGQNRDKQYPFVVSFLISFFIVHFLQYLECFHF